MIFTAATSRSRRGQSISWLAQRAPTAGKLRCRCEQPWTGDRTPTDFLRFLFLVARGTSALTAVHRRTYPSHLIAVGGLTLWPSDPSMLVYYALNTPQMRMRPRAPQSTQNQYTRAHARAPTPPPERYLPVDFVSRWAGTLYMWLRLFRTSSPLFFLRSVVANLMHSFPKHGSQRLAILALHILHRAFSRLCVQLPRCTTVTTTRALTLYLWEPFRKEIGVCFFS